MLNKKYSTKVNDFQLTKFKIKKPNNLHPNFNKTVYYIVKTSRGT